MELSKIELEAICAKRVEMSRNFWTPSLSSEEKEILLGTLLGDGSLVYNQKTPFVQWTFGNKKYAEFLNHKLERICVHGLPKERVYFVCLNCRKRFFKDVLICSRCKKGKGFLSKRFEYRFQTKALVELEKIKKLILKKNSKGDLKKTITLDWLNQLTNFSLAIWFMDDGSFSGKSLRFYTLGFSFLEHKILQQYFEKRWNIFTHIRMHKQKGKKMHYYLVIDLSSNHRFKETIKRFIPNFMVYKLGKDNE